MNSLFLPKIENFFFLIFLWGNGGCGGGGVEGGIMPGIEFKALYRNVVLNCIKFEFSLQAEPLITLEPGHGYLYGARWSPARPLVFALASEEGSVLVYDLKHNKAAPKYKLETADAKKKHPLYSIQFNPYRLVSMYTYEFNFGKITTYLKKERGIFAFQVVDILSKKGPRRIFYRTIFCW